jgi:hypothetical protein
MRSSVQYQGPNLPPRPGSLKRRSSRRGIGRAQHVGVRMGAALRHGGQAKNLRRTQIRATTDFLDAYSLRHLGVSGE